MMRHSFQRRRVLPLVPLLCTVACSGPQTAKEINQECATEFQAARTAVRLRDKGRPAELLKQQLAPIDVHSSRLLIRLHQIVDEAYAHTAMNETVYAVYHFELCQREFLRKPVPTKLQQIEPALLACQQQFGNQSSSEATICIQQAFDGLRQTPDSDKPATPPPLAPDHPHQR